MDARRFVMFAALDVAADEGGDREVLLGELERYQPPVYSPSGRRPGPETGRR